MKNIHLFIAGDSTAAAKAPEKRPESGWGEYLESFFQESLTVCNHAQNGRSTKSFLNEGRLAIIEEALQPGDYLFIQFGHNDQKEDRDRGTAPFGDYQTNLSRYIAAARKKQAQPVLLTSVTRRSYLENGELDAATLGDYPQAMRELAVKEQVPVLDIFSLTQAKYRALTPEKTKKLHLHLAKGSHKNYPDGVEDNTHFNEAGAKRIAALIAQTIALSSLPLKDYLK